MNGHLFVIAGPSGVGKTTLEHRLVEEMQGLHYSVSVTTRGPRPGEVDGEAYFFISQDEFERMRAAGELLEWAAFYGHRYGTPARFVRENLAAGRDILVDVEVEGLAQLRERFGEAIYILIVPPSMDELRRRLSHRNTEDRAAAAERLKRAAYELRRLFEMCREEEEGRGPGHFYVIINDKLETAYQELKEIVLAARAGPVSRAALPSRIDCLARLSSVIE